MNWKILLISIAVIPLIIYGSLKFGELRFSSLVKNEQHYLFSQTGESANIPVTESQLSKLPEPVQKYLEYALVPGKKPVKRVTIEQEGYIRQSPDKNSMAFEAIQYYSTDPGGFIWKARMNILPGIDIVVRDKYIDGHGNMLIKLLSLFTLEDATGYEMDQGTMLRFVNEHVFFPTAFLNDYLTWIAIDDISAELKIHLARIEARAIVYFNSRGELINFETERYRSLPDGRFELTRWSTPMSNYKEMGGFRIPTHGQAVWHLSTGNFPYVDIEIKNITYE